MENDVFCTNLFPFYLLVYQKRFVQTDFPLPESPLLVLRLLDLTAGSGSLAKTSNH